MARGRSWKNMGREEVLTLEKEEFRGFYSCRRDGSLSLINLLNTHFGTVRWPGDLSLVLPFINCLVSLRSRPLSAETSLVTPTLSSPSLWPPEGLSRAQIPLAWGHPNILYILVGDCEGLAPSTIIWVASSSGSERGGTNSNFFYEGVVTYSSPRRTNSC